MAEARSSVIARDLVRDFRLLNFEQKVAAAGALLLVVSTFGPFSFVEVAEVLLAAGVLLLLRQRAQGKRFHLPFGDGTVVVAAGCWAGVLILLRLFDRPPGPGLCGHPRDRRSGRAGEAPARRPADRAPALVEPLPGLDATGPALCDLIRHEAQPSPQWHPGVTQVAFSDSNDRQHNPKADNKYRQVRTRSFTPVAKAPTGGSSFTKPRGRLGPQ
jgi:hypothetical protein